MFVWVFTYKCLSTKGQRTIFTSQFSPSNISGPRNWTQVTRLGSRPSYALSTSAIPRPSLVCVITEVPATASMLNWNSGQPESLFPGRGHSYPAQNKLPLLLLEEGEGKGNTGSPWLTGAEICSRPLGPIASGCSSQQKRGGGNASPHGQYGDKEKRGWGPRNSFKGWPQWPSCLLLLNTTPLPSSSLAGDQVSNTWTLRDVPDPNDSTVLYYTML